MSRIWWHAGVSNATFSGKGEPARGTKAPARALDRAHRGMGGDGHRSQGAPYPQHAAQIAKPMDIRVIVLLSKLQPAEPIKSGGAKRGRNGASDPPKWDYLLSARGSGGPTRGIGGGSLPPAG